MANKNLCIFILIATIVAQATWVRAAKDYQVGDFGEGYNGLGWDETTDFQAWLKGKEFNQGDRLYFGYKAGEHNVVVLSDQAALDSCTLTNPRIASASCGYNLITLSAGPNFITSGIGEDCKNGMKLKIDAKPAPALMKGRHLIL
ncbi:putative Phytocyanin domain, cupredoxin [Helianthus anomalus]